MLNFDENGFLTPFRAIQTDLETVRNTFVYNERRAAIFKNYEEFLDRFQAMGFTGYFQWLNGSFVTQKTNPGDLDVVTFIPILQFEKHESQLKRQLWNSPLLDCFFERLFPENHPMVNVSKMDMAEWNALYCTTRRDKITFKRYSKGFIQLNF